MWSRLRGGILWVFSRTVRAFRAPASVDVDKALYMSHFSWIDGSIVGLYLLVTMIAGISVRKYVGKVEHFLVAGREMDVYLGIASLAATEFGIVTCMSAAELGYKHGFAGATDWHHRMRWPCSWSAAPAFASSRCAIRA